MKTIKLAGKFSHLECILDDDWAQMFEDGGISLSHKEGYALVVNRFKGEYVREKIHSVIADFIGSTRGFVVDHINGNKLDNRRINLRKVTHRENCLNKNNALSKLNKSGIRGLCFSNSCNHWIVQYKINGKRCYFKRFKTKDEASLIAEFHNEIRE